MMEELGLYIYGIVAAENEDGLDIEGIVPEEDVKIICHDGIGTIVSPSPVKKYEINRKNTLAHQRVMEKAMETFHLLPVRFGTIAKSENEIREKVLKKRCREFKENLDYIKDKNEVGLKALWKDKDQVFQEIISENKRIRQLKDRLNSQKGGQHRDRIRLGDMVVKALESKKEKKGKMMLNRFDGLFAEHKRNKLMGDQMILNSVFLVLKTREENFDRAVEELDQEYGERIKIKYIGPVPPCNFIELTISL